MVDYVTFIRNNESTVCRTSGEDINYDKLTPRLAALKFINDRNLRLINIYEILRTSAGGREVKELVVWYYKDDEPEEQTPEEWPEDHISNSYEGLGR